MISFSSHYDGEPVPASVYEEGNWRTTNMQVLTGTTSPTPLKIVVVDLDGEGALEEWTKICQQHDHSYSQTWVARTGSGGHHIYYSLKPEILTCPSGILWGIWEGAANEGRGGWRKHCEMRLLADRNLVVSPPSVHIKTGREYTFLKGCSPKDHRTPSEAPQWLIDMPRLQAPIFTPPRDPQEPVYYTKFSVLPDTDYSRGEVLDAVRNKVQVARSWGVKFTRGNPTAAGWISCHVPGREDANPSGSFHVENGTLLDFKSGETMSFFDVGVACGIYFNWRECVNELGQRYIANRKKPTNITTVA